MPEKKKNRKSVNRRPQGSAPCTCPHDAACVQKVLLDWKEVIYATGLSKDTLYIHIRTGALPSIKEGRRRLFRPDEVETWARNLPRAA